MIKKIICILAVILLYSCNYKEFKLYNLDQFKVGYKQVLDIEITINGNHKILGTRTVETKESEEFNGIIAIPIITTISFKNTESNKIESFSDTTYIKRNGEDIYIVGIKYGDEEFIPEDTLLLPYEARVGDTGVNPNYINKNKLKIVSSWELIKHKKNNAIIKVESTTYDENGNKIMTGEKYEYITKKGNYYAYLSRGIDPINQTVIDIKSIHY